MSLIIIGMPLLLPSRGIYPHQIKFMDAMLNAEFCYSPLGGHGGDTGGLTL